MKMISLPDNEREDLVKADASVKLIPGLGVVAQMMSTLGSRQA